MVRVMVVVAMVKRPAIRVAVVGGAKVMAPRQIFDSHDPVTPVLLWEFPIPMSFSPVGGRLALFWKNWQVVGAEKWKSLSGRRAVSSGLKTL